MKTPKTNLGWWHLILGLYPKDTPSEDRERLNQARKPLDVYAVGVANVIAATWNRKRKYANPGQHRIGDAAGIGSTDTVVSRIELLKELGWLTYEVRQGRAGTRYFLWVPGTSHAVGHSPEEERPTSAAETSHASGLNVPRGGSELEQLHKELPAVAAAHASDDQPERITPAPMPDYIKQQLTKFAAKSTMLDDVENMEAERNRQQQALAEYQRQIAQEEAS